MPNADLNSPIVPAFEIIVNGAKLSEELDVVSVTVDDELDLPGMFAFEIATREVGEDAYAPLDAATFDVGGAVEVKLGYADNVGTVFVGEITGLETEIAADAPPSFTVRGFDRRHRLTRGRKTRSFVKHKDSDIAATVAREAGLRVEVEDSEVTHEYVLQANQTDMEFLLERAARINYELAVDDGTLLFRRRAVGGDAVVTLAAGDSLLEFYARLSSAEQVSQVSVRGWDAAAKDVLVGLAAAGDEASKMGGEVSGAELARSAFDEADAVITALPVMTQAEADQLARGRLNERVLGLVNCEGVCFGTTLLRSGSVLEVRGVGRRFSGLYYVTAVNHRVTGEGGYRTRFAARRSAS